MVIKKYRERAVKDFNNALVKFTAFEEEHAQNLLISDFYKFRDKVDKFVEGLGFDIYCEDYIICMAEHVGNLLTKLDTKEKRSYTTLIALIMTQYESVHSDCVTDSYKSVRESVKNVYHLETIRRILSGEH